MLQSARSTKNIHFTDSFPEEKIQDKIEKFYKYVNQVFEIIISGFIIFDKFENFLSTKDENFIFKSIYEFND